MVVYKHFLFYQGQETAKQDECMETVLPESVEEENIPRHPTLFLGKSKTTFQSFFEDKKSTQFLNKVEIHL